MFGQDSILKPSRQESIKTEDSDETLEKYPQNLEGSGGSQKSFIPWE